MDSIKWHLNNELPKYEGHYIVTRYTSLMSGSSYAWIVGEEYFDGEEWAYDGVMAWADFPPFDAFVPANEEERKIVFENEYRKKPHKEPVSIEPVE